MISWSGFLDSFSQSSACSDGRLFMHRHFMPSISLSFPGFDEENPSIHACNRAFLGDRPGAVGGGIDLVILGLWLLKNI